MNVRMISKVMEWENQEQKPYMHMKRVDPTLFDSLYLIIKDDLFFFLGFLFKSGNATEEPTNTLTSYFQPKYGFDGVIMCGSESSPFASFFFFLGRRCP